MVKDRRVLRAPGPCSRAACIVKPVPCPFLYLLRQHHHARHGRNGHPDLDARACAVRILDPGMNCLHPAVRMCFLPDVWQAHASRDQVTQQWCDSLPQDLALVTG